jgi:tRNA A37 methylthiotransferase MiaB
MYLPEVAELAAQHVKEITLFGQNVNAYRGALEESGDLAQKTRSPILLCCSIRG